MKFKKIFVIFAIMIFSTLNIYAKSDGYIVKFKNIPHGLDTAIFEEIIPEEGIYKVSSLEELDGYRDEVEYTEKDTEVQFTLPDEPSPMINLMAIPNDNIYPEQWALTMVKAQYFWQHETYGNEVRVAVIDSGCNPHDDLSDNLLVGKNFLNNSTDTSDDHGHGTHVSGIIGAEINSRGTVGVAPKAKIVPIKIMSKTDSCTIAQLSSAIRSAVNDFDCKVLNMSWGISSKNLTLKSALDYAYNKGAILVSAVGNDGVSALSYPAAFDNVIGVGSVDSEKVRSSFSRYNKSVDIMAPGTRILSTYSSNNYAYMSGTSQASPHIAGIAALALSADSTITPAKFYTMLTETADDLGDAGYDYYYGHGLVNTEALMNKILQKKDYYISPTNYNNGENYVLIKNNTDNFVTIENYFVKFNGNRFIGATKTPMMLDSGDTAIAVTNLDSYSHFLWDDGKPLIAKQ